MRLAALRSRSGASRYWLTSCLRQEHDLILSVPLMVEYEAVLTREEILRDSGVTLAFAGRLLDALAARSIQVQSHYLWRPLLRDPDDEMVVEAAVAGKADMILSFNVRDFAGAERIGLAVAQPGPALAAFRRP